MHTEYVLLRFGELTLKGRNRTRFENIVLSHIERLLKPFPKTKITRTYGRIYIALNGEPYEEIAARLKKVFGLSSFSPVAKADLDLQAIRRTALNMFRSLPELPKTFKVSVRRAYKDFPYNSQELNHLIGGYILANTEGLKVDVHQPEFELKVEIREEGAFIYSEVVPGPGGFPLGSSGKALLMLSGGIDSPVAGWLAMRRGVEIEAVHFHSYPYTSERAKQKVIDLTRQLSDYAKEIKLHLVPFTEIQTKLNENKNKNLLITMMRRAMFRITEKLAERRHAQAIVTGENLGQVASQTLSSLNVIGRVTNLPVLRPLITMDKQEIIQLAEQIGTYSISILPYEDCCTIFLPKSPSTNPNLHIVERLESAMPWLSEKISEAVEKTETMTIKKEDVPSFEHLF